VPSKDLRIWRVGSEKGIGIRKPASRDAVHAASMISLSLFLLVHDALLANHGMPAIVWTVQV